MKEKRSKMHLSGDRWFPRCSLVFLMGLFISFVLGMFLTLFYFDLLPMSYGAEPYPTQSHEDEAFNRPNFSSLNVRLLAKPITPPNHIVKRTVLLENLQEGLPVTGGGIRSAIIEDDARRQVLILSAQGKLEPNEPLHVYLLYDFDLESRIPTLKQCTKERQCAQDRQPGTGGLACIAICMVNALHPPTS